MSLCDVCLSPGACCKKLTLEGGYIGDGIGEPMSRERAEHYAMGMKLPMIPSEQMPDGRWFWSCTQLQADGRCGIYEDRPDVCRDYEPGSSSLCVHYWPDPDLTGL